MNVTFTRHGFARGAKLALSIVPGMLPFGVVVGVLADAKGLSFLEITLMSALVFAGSSQLVALELWANPAPILAASFAAFVVNLRLAPMGAALAPWLDRLRGWKLWGTLATLVDNSFAFAVADQRAGGRDAGLLLGVGATLWVFWVSFVALGHAFAGLLSLPPGHPVFFASLATMIALLVPIWRGKRDLLPWVAAGATALVIHQAGFGQPWPVLGGALLGAVTGAWRDRRR